MMIAVGFINRQTEGESVKIPLFVYSIYSVFTNELRSLAHNHYEYATQQDKDY